MTATNVNRQAASPGRYARLVSLASGLLGMAIALPLWAENVLQNVSYEAGAAGKVDITLQLAEPAGDVQAFTTDDPPRIAIDLPDTRNALSQRRVTVGSGATSAVSAVEAGGRTRVVIDLFRAASFETRTEGNRIIVSVAGGAGTASAAAAAADPTDPAKRLPSSLALSDIDFRRTDEGAGRIILRFNGEGAATDLRNEDKRIVVDITNARLADSMTKRLDVVDFATPVETIQPTANAGGTRLVISTRGGYESMAYQTGNEYVVEVAPKRDPGAAGTIGATAAAGEVKRYTGRPVTFNFQDIPVRTVLQLVAEESNLNVVAADSVQGNVTLRLINVPWDQALDIVLRAKSLDKRQDGNVIWVAPQAELAAYEQAKEDARIAIEQRTELVTEYIPINYGNAEEIASLLTDESKSSQGGGAAGGAGGQATRGFLSPRGSVSFDRRTNTLLVVDIPKKVEEIRQLVALLDRPVDQVLIEARIVIAQDSFGRELGARFGISGNKDDVYYSGDLETNSTNRNADVDAARQNANLFRQFLIDQQTNPDAVPPVPVSSSITRGLNVNLPVTEAAGSLALSILNAGYLLDLELSAMQTEGRGEVVSNPRVITSNQREALIRQGDEVGYITIAAQQGAGVAIPQVEFKEVVLELKVTPTITQDGRVFLDMGVKKDEIEGFVSSSIGDVPQIATREVNTAVLVESGQTVVIGGVYEFNSREDLRKVPFLGDVPVLGNLFKHKNRRSSKAELLIFVTPRILNVQGKQ